ncbi:DUF418 domain-containing protein [Brevibacillus sp. RS1.1]|uniref:DUF418 domain-containing protein n=1 Tax=Brevibacillus sp. RS1.1 TaxID=2738982 RepID=UPI00156A9444|nr:DUF418 domain-containing protein [Brevibacillus sp. RS1.1]NRR00782.1 DUF418 domain-containing protein [Brevibacillus sp. RS1.1]
MNKINSYTRIDIMDYLRGFALIGVLLVNSFQVMNNVSNYNELHAGLYYIFNSKFYPILFFLFGLGSYFFMNRSQQQIKNRYLLFFRRICFLFVLGLIHTFYAPSGIHDVLMQYAVLGLFIALFFKTNQWTNLVVTIILIILSIVTAFCQPYYGERIAWLELISAISKWLSLMMIGFTMGQFKIMENIYAKVKHVLIFLIGIICAYVILYFVNIAVEITPAGIEILEDYLVSSMMVSILIISLQWNQIKAILSPLKLYGQMSLTNYLAQSALLIVFSSMISIHSLITFLIIHAVLLTGSSIWLKYFKMGPVELLLRSFTYWSKIQIKKTKQVEK